MKKYELTSEVFEMLDIYGECECKLFRIKAIRDFGDIKAGDLGGWIESQENLSHEGNCWVTYDSKVYEAARISDNAQVYGCSDISGYAQISGNAQVYGCSDISGYAQISGNAKVYDSSIYCLAEVFGDSEVIDSEIHEQAKVFGNAKVIDTRLFGNAEIFGNAEVKESHIRENAKVYGEAFLYNGVSIRGRVQVFGNAKVNYSTLYGDAQIFGLSDITESIIYGNAKICGDHVVISDSNIGGSTTVSEKAAISGVTLGYRSNADIASENDIIWIANIVPSSFLTFYISKEREPYVYYNIDGLDYKLENFRRYINECKEYTVAEKKQFLLAIELAEVKLNSVD